MHLLSAKIIDRAVVRYVHLSDPHELNIFPHYRCDPATFINLLAISVDQDLQHYRKMIARSPSACILIQQRNLVQVFYHFVHHIR